jgi:catechol 2,3-dioxygenase-like lactoylglutathione lyase family enzyme
MKVSLEVVILRVSDPEPSLRFYRDQVGFDLDVDHAPTPDFRVIQLTPQGSSALIQFGVGLTDAPAGSVCGLSRRHRPCPRRLPEFADFRDPGGNACVLQERGHSPF